MNRMELEEIGTQFLAHDEMFYPFLRDTTVRSIRLRVWRDYMNDRNMMNTSLINDILNDSNKFV